MSLLPIWLMLAIAVAAANHHRPVVAVADTFVLLLRRMHLDPYVGIGQLFDEDQWPHIEHLNQCYDPTVSANNGSSRSIDVFRHSLGAIVSHYFMEFPNLINGENAFRRVQCLVANVRQLVAHLQACSRRPPNRRRPLGLTSLSAHSPAEFRQRLAGNLSHHVWRFYQQRKLGSNVDNKGECEFRMNPADLPKTMDLSNTLPDAKDQGQCGCCFIFSGVATIESAWNRAHGGGKSASEKPVSLSEQEWLNCLSGGCDGGLQNDLYDGAQKNGGLASESSMPYKGTKEKCTHPNKVASFKSFCFDYRKHFDMHLQVALFKYGAVGVGIDASNSEFQSVKDVYEGTCNDKLNHAVTVVGYDANYWLVRNSWGTGWGKKGYFRLTRRGNRCNINMVLAYVTV